jgi:mannitol operon repressor
MNASDPLTPRLQSDGRLRCPPLRRSERVGVSRSYRGMPSSRKESPLTFEAVQAAFAEFQDESDRAAAILSIALLDTQLEEILRAFAADEASISELVKPEQPIGSLGARRRVCLALGLISPDEASELALLGKIRNEFAHKLHGLTFEAQPIADWVQSLALPQRLFPRYRSSGRPRFISSVAFMHLLLTRRLDAARKNKRRPAPQEQIELERITKEEFERARTDP